MTTLNVIRAGDLPAQIHRRQWPMPAAIEPVTCQYSTGIEGGLWTSSLDDAGTTAWARMCAAIQRNAAPPDQYRADAWQRFCTAIAPKTTLPDWQLHPDPDARILVIDTAGDYQALLDRYGFNVGGRYFPAWRLDWERIAANYDALRVTAQGVSAVGDRSASPLRDYGLESTLWLRWCFTGFEPATIQAAATQAEQDTSLFPGYHLYTEDVDAINNGFRLPDDFHPEIDTGYLTVPITADDNDCGLVIAFSRLYQHAFMCGAAWPEVAGFLAKLTVWYAAGFRAFVEIRNRYATGIVIRINQNWQPKAHMVLLLAEEDTPRMNARLDALMTAAGAVKRSD